MRSWLLRSPWWVLALFSGAWFTLAGVLVSHVLDDRSWTGSLGGPLVGGVIFGGLMGPFARRQNRRMEAAVGLAGGSRRAVQRAARRGPVPADPEVRAAAVRLVDHQLAQAQRHREVTIALGSCFVVLYGWLALTGSVFWWLVAALFAGALVQTLRAPARLRRRRALLGHPRQGSGERSDEVQPLG